VQLVGQQDAVEAVGELQMVSIAIEPQIKEVWS
jgi:hypothetical protein